MLFEKQLTQTSSHMLCGTTSFAQQFASCDEKLFHFVSLNQTLEIKVRISQ